MVWVSLGDSLENALSDLECDMEKLAGNAVVSARRPSIEPAGEEEPQVRYPAPEGEAETENGEKTEAEAPAKSTGIEYIEQSGERPLCKPKASLRCLTTDNPVRRTLRGAVGKHLKLVWSQ